MAITLHLERECWHVVPTNDLRPHVEKGLRCWCQPDIQQHDNGNVLVVHNSADGREFYEGEVKGH